MPSHTPKERAKRPKLQGKRKDPFRKIKKGKSKGGKK